MSTIWEKIPAGHRAWTENGWIVLVMSTFPIHLSDPDHTWNGLDIWEPLPGGGFKLRTENGWIVDAGMDLGGGACYFTDENHSWVPKLIPEPAPEPTPPPPEPIPEPTPPPPADSSGIMSVPTKVENMAEVSPSVWKSQNLAGTKAAVLQFKLPTAVPRGARLRVSYGIASNVVLDNGRNIKWGPRNWLGAIGNANQNDYTGTQKTGSPIFCTEQVPTQITAKKDVNGNWLPWTRTYISATKPTTTPVTHAYDYRFNSAPGVGDGKVVIEVGGSPVFSADHWISDSITKPGTRDIVCLQMVYAPISGDAGQLPADAWVEFRDIAIEVLP